MQVSTQKCLWLLLAVLIIVLDQYTKQWAVATLTYAKPLPFLPFFNWTLLHNYGAAFSFLSDAGGWQRWFLGVVALLVSVFLVVWIVRINNNKRLELAGLALVLGGAVGNLWDRLILGYVVDFIDWFYPTANGCLVFFYSRPELRDKVAAQERALKV